MQGSSLEARYRLLAAAFCDSASAASWKERLGTGFGEALDVLVFVLWHDLGEIPKTLDREHLRLLLATLLPGRLAGREPWCGELVDLLEEFLLFVAEAEGLASQWEWVSALGEGRADFLEALDNPKRPVLSRPRFTPDRRPAPKLGRNDPCPCGSGKKYKHCCQRLL